MKFIVVRFAPGSGGKFVSTLLQLSPDVNAWNDQIKTDHALAWFQLHFRNNFEDWLKNEPEVPYATGFVSNRFNRGDDIPLSQALDRLSTDTLFQAHWANNKKICLISNKSQVPNWIQDQCVFVNLVIDNVKAQKWCHRCRLHKQFLLAEPNTWIIKQDHPDYCSSARSVLAQKFNNPTTYQGTTQSFLKKYIVNDPITRTFLDPAQIVEHSSNRTQQQLFVDLSKIIDPDVTADTINTICKSIGIAVPNLDLVSRIAEHYSQIHQSICKI